MTIEKPIIKKHKNKNNYLLTPSGYWVRDFNQVVTPVDINHFTQRSEYKSIAENEINVLTTRIPMLGQDFLPRYDKILIVSDGYAFNEAKDLLNSIPPNVCIIGTNRTLAKWPMKSDKIPYRVMNYFMVNNPYPECLNYLPKHNYWPQCLVSLRTYPGFVKKYKGSKFYYTPVSEVGFGYETNTALRLDDYRNPICAAVSMAKKLQVRKLALLCCDDVFVTDRPTAIQLPNKLWMYPQHKTSHELIDGCLYWLKQQEDMDIKVANCSNGPEYQNAEYIKKEELTEFFLNG